MRTEYGPVRLAGSEKIGTGKIKGIGIGSGCKPEEFKTKERQEAWVFGTTPGMEYFIVLNWFFAIGWDHDHCLLCDDCSLSLYGSTRPELV